MKVETCLHKGAIHENHNEDALYHTVIEDKWLLAAVMDGCSTGNESFFASTLYKKLIRKSCNTIPFLDQVMPDLSIDKMDVKDLGEYILQQVFQDMSKYSKLLMLDKTEILSTLILAVFSVPSEELWVNISGDGYISVNNKIMEFDQNNVPDFMGYHLKEEFSGWISNNTETVFEKNVHTFKIATDGISKFFNAGVKKPELIDYSKSFLASEDPDPEQTFTRLKKKNHFPYDDIAVIQVNSK